MSSTTSPLITAAQLAAVLDGPEEDRPVVLDVRYPGVGSAEDGHAQYLAGHVPGAAYVSLDDALAAEHVPGVTGRHPLPEPSVLQDAMRAAGVREERPVVVYDDWLSIAAARAWWLLRWAGHDDVRVLDGGWRPWQGSGRPVETGEAAPEPGDLTVRPGHRRTVDADGAAALARDGVLLDARPAGRFRGEGETIDPVAGHVPGAHSLPTMELVDDTGRFLPVEALAARLTAVGVEPGTDGAGVGIYCGSGVQACHAALAAEAAGVVRDPAVYAGSWSEWVTDPSRPVATGPED